MIILVILLLFGVIASFFAGQNTSGVTIHAFAYQLTEIPLYLVVFGSMLIGVMVAWLISLVNDTSSFFTVRRKDKTIESSQHTITDLEKKIHDLELENTKLRSENSQLPIADKLRNHMPTIT